MQQSGGATMCFNQLICVLFVLNCCQAARILGVFPTPSISHQVVFRAITLELVKRGHELVVVTPDPAFATDNPYPNLREIDVHDISYEIWLKVIAKFAEAEQNGQRSSTWQYGQCVDTFADVFDAQMDTPEVKSLLKDNNTHFDLIIVETLIRATHGLRHRFKVPVIGLSSLAAVVRTYDVIGVPTHPVLYADLLHSKVDINKMSLLDKLYVIYIYLYQVYYDLSHMTDKNNKIIKKHFGEDTPNVIELESQMDMMFMDLNPVWYSTRPVPPSVIYTGGIHTVPPKELATDLKSYLDNSTQGVVFMSFGSNVKSVDLLEDQRRIFVNVFKRLPYNVIWKWESDILPEKPDNVLISKWLPQMDLLRHKNVKVFITQCGQQSTDEAIQTGMPLIGIPFMADQEYHSAKYEAHGVGIALDIRTLTEHQLENAIRKVVEDKSYRENMQRMSRLMTDQPMTGMERAVWWTEHVLRHGGGRHLRSPTAGVSFAQYFMLDVIAALLLSSAISITCIITVFRSAYKLLRRNLKRKTD